ncbi:DNA mismatch repair endonuclease MutL [Vibrio sp. SS-MA-C1-2]|uniref:DNA mismatch repair endonuclease MutL n=1 Tax=Vibrio sp. SS-MA-C1-2 TaxID=2908646 RepID=UPI001F3B4FF5|nr:DNA mismatch repair endonuclease MutL [Vibrio sp. SS-MA-C1-2]UJF19531.1 DNA mismatch repair endonuclease MutL [Vibrio sp. SS-MA-C1-2]
MAIKILPARLANQIAAGEVVERPASVVKELVENSIDAGATRIDIDIEKGGSRLIRIRDNGKGIAKEELSLALSRHATSKIHTLDDLEAIMSLGFRGEALASISSVSRLTLTSRTTTQPEAWAAIAEGRDMAVEIKPAAHPIGTTIEVYDLFFNTPARRKFLKTEKTEFSHIDELLRRIALSRVDVSLTLKHNGKVVRQYRAATTTAQKEKRLAAVCGNAFVQNAVAIELEHDGMKLFGWTSMPSGSRQQNDLQYCYVNGRMMRDKLINHAIRQGYERLLSSDQYAAYVLFIEIDPHQVDVNVHPAKHEVRFHHSRLVHDFIYQGIHQALEQSELLDHQDRAALVVESRQTAFADHHYPNLVQGAENKSGREPGENDDLHSIGSVREQQNPFSSAEQDLQEKSNQYQSQKNVSNRSMGSQGGRKNELTPSRAEIEAYQTLLKTVDSHADSSYQRTRQAQESKQKYSAPQVDSAASKIFPTPKRQTLSTTVQKNDYLGRGLTVLQQHYLLLEADNSLQLLDLFQAQKLKALGQLQGALVNGLAKQPLLIPVVFTVNAEQYQATNDFQAILDALGFTIVTKGKSELIVKAVSQPLRQQNLPDIVPRLLNYLNESSELLTLLPKLVELIEWHKKSFTLSEAIQLIAELEQLWQTQLILQIQPMLRSLDYSVEIKAFNND